MGEAVTGGIVGPVTVGSQSRPEFLYGSSGPVGTTESVMILFFTGARWCPFLRPFLMPGFPHVKLLGK